MSATPPPAEIEAYLRAVSPAGRAGIAEVRRVVRALVPDAQERISYRIPTFFVGGKRLVHVAAWDKHLALYPIPPGDDGFAAAIAPYVKGKGTLHLPYGDPGVSRVIELVVAAHAARLGLVPAPAEVTFAGIPEGGVAFYRELAQHNSKEWWEANKARYASTVRDPMEHLIDLLADEFGEGRLYRPYRDVRFSNDKTPYKDHQGALVATGPGIGWYVQLSGTGLMMGGGIRPAGPAQLNRLRAAIDDETTGEELAGIVAALPGNGFGLRDSRLKTRPRGVPADHPRLDLLRHTSLVAVREYGTPPWLGRAEVEGRVRADWRSLRPLVEWLTRNVGGVEL